MARSSVAKCYCDGNEQRKTGPSNPLPYPSKLRLGMGFRLSRSPNHASRDICRAQIFSLRSANGTCALSHRGFFAISSIEELVLLQIR